MVNQFEDIEKMLNTEENVAETFQEILREHIKELQEKTGMSSTQIEEYISRIMVM